MNLSPSRPWNNPPPPGTELDDEASRSSGERRTDRFDPYLKNPAYIGREGEFSSDRSRYRSRSRDRRRRRRSRSRNRRRRTRSRSKHRRRRHSSSRSRSRSSDRHRRRRRRRSRSRSRRNRRRSVDRPSKKSPSSERDIDGDIIKEEDMKIEEEEEDDDVEEVTPIPFKNDGSFLEMFKKMQEQKAAEETVEQETKKPALPAFGKRRGGKVLKTGMVRKLRNNEEEGAAAQDAWSIYMKEVRKYKEACCDDDSKTRPLVK